MRPFLVGLASPAFASSVLTTTGGATHTGHMTQEELPFLVDGGGTANILRESLLHLARDIVVFVVTLKDGKTLRGQVGNAVEITAERIRWSIPPSELATIDYDIFVPLVPSRDIVEDCPVRGEVDAASLFAKRAKSWRTARTRIARSGEYYLNQIGFTRKDKAREPYTLGGATPLPYRPQDGSPPVIPLRG